MAVRKLWQRRLTDGAEISAALFHDTSLAEATAEITVRSTHAEDALTSRRGLPAPVPVQPVEQPVQRGHGGGCATPGSTTWAEHIRKL